MLIIIVYLLIFFEFIIVQSSHFYGGIVTWKPLNNTANGSTISIKFTQSYQWRRSYTNSYCNQSYIVNQSPKIPNDLSKLTCVTTPSSSCGGYVATSISEYCTDFSAITDSSSGQISYVQNITIGSKFCVAFQSSSWIALQVNCGTSSVTSSNTTTISTTTMPSCYSSAAAWSIGCCIDLSTRSNGFINTPPVATILSPVRVVVNTVTSIKIPVIDADNDFTRCRWAKQTSTLNECGGVCGITPGGTLYNDNCTLIFDSTGKTIGDYYVVALMIEDFENQTTNTSYSSVPIQFLIRIFDTPICPLKPTINSTLHTCTAIQVGISFSFTVTITQGCTGTTISDFFRMPPLYMYKDGITQVGSSNVWTITETWTPTTDQVGSQVYCAIATDSANISSEQYCLTFTVVPADQIPLCPRETTTLTPNSTDTQTTEMTTISSTDSQGYTSLYLGLGLGLGIPLLLLLSGLTLYMCCCQQCKNFSSKFSRHLFKRTRTVNNQSQLPDYRQQYINDDSSTSIRPLTQDSMTAISVSDFQSTYLNMTKTSFFSPSVNSLPTDDVPYTKNYSSSSIHLNHNDSILMRAYATQENQKIFYN